MRKHRNPLPVEWVPLKKTRIVLVWWVTRQTNVHLET
jgi:hypothetical protein